MCGCAWGALLLTPIIPNAHGLTVTVSRWALLLSLALINPSKHCHQTLPSRQYGIPIFRIPSWIAHWNINQETPLEKYLDKNHHRHALIQYKPHISLIGKWYGENYQKSMSLPPLLCKQVEVWIHYKSIIVLSYHSASKHMMELHQNKFQLLVSRLNHFHPHFISSLYNFSIQNFSIQLIFISHQGCGSQHSFQNQRKASTPKWKTSHGSYWWAHLAFLAVQTIYHRHWIEHQHLSIHMCINMHS